MPDPSSHDPAPAVPPKAQRPLGDRVALVTGVSRRRGIGTALARRLLEDGALVLAQSCSDYDAGKPYGADPEGADAVLADLAPHGDLLRHVALDLAEPAAPRRLVGEAVTAFGGIDILVVNHTRAPEQSLTSVTAEELDRTWAVNVRATLLLVQAFAATHDDRRPGRVVLFTSGQHLGPMGGDIPYTATKGAIHQLTLTLSDVLADRGITVNAVNPGPTDTGWAPPELTERLAAAFPARRWGTPDDAARLVAWLVSDEAAWVTGQVIDSEGGFRRSTGVS
jgi:3-oxoacyl-[acyl-carrier protein] reductase